MDFQPGVDHLPVKRLGLIELERDVLDTVFELELQGARAALGPRGLADPPNGRLRGADLGGQLLHTGGDPLARVHRELSSRWWGTTYMITQSPAGPRRQPVRWC